MNPYAAPFKFLDSYQKEDSDIFFGREKETGYLYEALSGVKHLLVYGPAGAGKTSLIECGLRNLFSDMDWFALTIRRGPDIIESVFTRINEALRNKIAFNPKTKRPLDPDTDFGQAIENLFAERYQPVYLLFDQFEELLISGSEDEKKDFFTRLNQLVRYKVPCRVLLIMREEFIGHLSEFEPLCPSIFQHRFRVEKMRMENVKSVIRETLDAPYFQKNFRVDKSERLAERMLSKLPDNSREIELAHVQVFLSELWNRARAAQKLPALPLLHEGLVKPKDDLTGILDKFLKKEIDELDKTYGEKAPLETLAAMISNRYTKLQISESDIRQDLLDKEVQLNRPLAELLRDLEKRRIVRTLKSGEQTQYEISHDLLALVVGKNLTREMEMRTRASDIYRVYEERKGHLSQEDLELIRPYQQYKAYPLALEQRIKESEAELYRKQREELKKAKRQAEHERKLREQAERATSEAEIEHAQAEAQRIIAEQNEAEARINEKRARQRTRFAALAMMIALGLALLAWKSYAEIRIKNRVAFESFAHLGSDLIYSMDHLEALEKMKVAIDIEVDIDLKRQQLIQPISELLYFFSEGGRRPTLARTAAGLLIQLNQDAELDLLLRQCLKDRWSTREQFAPVLKKLTTFSEFKSRYFPEFVPVPLGKDSIFTMGSDTLEWKHQDDEQLHQVKLSAYQISVTPITFYQFAMYSEAVDRSLLSRTPYWGRLGDHPVVNVSWYEALEYANWLNTHQGFLPTYDIHKVVKSDSNNFLINDLLKWMVEWRSHNKGYRLPTEAEWELAARAGVGAPRTLFAGSDTIEIVGWSWENSGDERLSSSWDPTRIYDNNGRTHPVKQKRGNSIGIHDMSGNVYEWCWDWYDSNYYTECKKRGIVQNPLGPKSSTDGRVLRGGSWYYEARSCRVANRSVYGDYPDLRDDDIGFRLVFVL